MLCASRECVETIQNFNPVPFIQCVGEEPSVVGFGWADWTQVYTDAWRRREMDYVSSRAIFAVRSRVSALFREREELVEGDAAV